MLWSGLVPGIDCLLPNQTQLMRKCLRIKHLVWIVYWIQLPLFAQKMASTETARLPKENQNLSKPLKLILSELETRYKVSIAYKAEMVENVWIEHKVFSETLPDLEATLSHLLKGKNLHYDKLDNRFYVIVDKATTEKSKASPPNPRTGMSSEAPELRVTGKVIDEDGSSLPGVSILLKGTSDGTTTDAFGKYSMLVPGKESSLIFSFIGFATKEVPVGDATVLDITLSTDVKSLSEIVVTALGVKREEKSLGYSVQKLDLNGMDQARETNVINSMQGKVAGVQITGALGNIGGSSRINIRGANSLSGNNQPLFIVDGTPIDNSSFNEDRTSVGGGGRDYGNAAQDINPDDIESVSVLKGPTAAALYGSRASNGVIMITTKSGKSRKGIGISFNNSLTFETPLKLPDFQNEYGGGYTQEFDTYTYKPGISPAEYASFDGQPTIAYYADESWGPKMQGQMVRAWDSWYPGTTEFGKLTPFLPNPDNVKNFYETGMTRSNNISLSGGNDLATFRLSFTNVDQKGILPNSSLKRNTLSLNTNAKLNNHWSVGAVVNYINTAVKGRPATGDYQEGGASSITTNFNQWHERQLDFQSMKNYMGADGRQRTWNITDPEDVTAVYWNNPYYELYENYNNDGRDRIFGNVSLTYALNEYLKITGFARTDFYNNRIYDRVANGGRIQSNFQETLTQRHENNYELLAQFQKNLGNDFALSVNAGSNIRLESTDQNYAHTVGGLNVPNYYTIQASIDRPDITDYHSERRVHSAYGSASLSFRDMLFLDGSLRNDWSSTLPANNNSYLYPSGALSFVFTELLPQSGFLSFGKVRASIAQVGKDTDPYRIKTVYRADGNYNGKNGSFSLFTVPNTLNNANLKPEISTSYEFGLNTKLFGGRVNIDATYYHNSSVDQIIDLAVSGTSGASNIITNAGKLTNEGIELLVNGTILKAANGLTWDMTLNWAKNKNRVVELANGQDTYQLNTTTFYGVNVVAVKGQSYGSLIGTGYATDDQGRRLIDESGFYVKQNNLVFGNILPDFTGGISNGFSYKGFNLNVLVDFRKGSDVFSGTANIGRYAGLFSETVGTNANGKLIRDPVDQGGGMLVEGVMANGTPNTTYIEAKTYFKNLSDLEAASTFDASFVKLRELRFGYTFPKEMLKKLPFQSISLSVVGRNLALLYSNMPHIDPETNLGSGNVQGIEAAQLPSVRSMGFNLNFGF
jgi:TonB-linked SusC/RagA family outer membrane protein